MFNRGISDEKFLTALRDWKEWDKIAADKELFFAMRENSVHVYYQGCRIFNISYDHRLLLKTHYKYLINPYMNDPYISWSGEGNSIKKRVDEIFIESLDTNLLKKAASYYAGAEKQGVHEILKSNNNIIDVEIALSIPAEKEQEREDEIKASTEAHADRIDFVALQKSDGTARIVFFEAKRFKNPELKAEKGDARVISQLKRYETFIANEKHQHEIKTSYRRVCQNLLTLAPRRCDAFVKKVAENDEIKLAVDPKVRLVVFDYSADEKKGKFWKDHEKKLIEKLGETGLLMKGKPKGFVNGISKYRLETPS